MQIDTYLLNIANTPDYSSVNAASVQYSGDQRLLETQNAEY